VRAPRSGQAPDDAVERIEPAETTALELALHVSRYRFAAPLVAGRSVLDAGCGVGYGSTDFATEPPRSYIGVDRSVQAIRVARWRYGAQGRRFLAADVGALPFRASQFDVVLSFEVVEHLGAVEPYLQELRRVLRPGGTCVVSTPNKRWFSGGLSIVRNPYHVREYYSAEFADLLREYFPAVTLMGQHDGVRAQVVRGAEMAYGKLLDRSGLRRLRRLVPRWLRTWAHVAVVNLASRARGVRPARIEASDYTFTTDRVDDARILMGVCRAPQ